MSDSNNEQESTILKDSPLIVALDYPDYDQALRMANLLDSKSCRVKVGKELFTKEGPKVVEALHQKGFEVFLDLKFHDIPNTTANAVAVAAELGVWMVNVHVSGGRKMMEACVNKLATYRSPPLLIGVTVLTSMEEADLHELGIFSSPLDHVTRLGQLAKKSGLDGVVCSAQEASLLKSRLGDEFKLVTPGIRPAFAARGDQQRIMTPHDALASGSDYLVIGRPITQSESPLDALTSVMQEINKV
jgi:orotidine-5'-phosphate decarboxylase